MLKIHVKLLSAVRLITMRDMEVGMVYKGNKGLPKIVVHRTKTTISVRNLGNGVVCHQSFVNQKTQTRGLRPMKVFAIAKNDSRDIEKLVTKTQTV